MSTTSSVVMKPSLSQHLNYRPPTMCDWYNSRPYLQTSFPTDTSISNPFAADLGPIPIHSQESILIYDILSLMDGIDGEYIVVTPVKDPYEPRSFNISDCIDSSLADLVRGILPIASKYSIVSYFTHEYYQFSYGKVNHALVAGMKILLAEYSVLVGQLEKMLNANSLNLQQLWYYIQTSLQTMNMLAEIAVKIHNSKAMGGQVLSLLHSSLAMYSGDATLHRQCLRLLEDASVPYMQILQGWVYNGVIRDECQEFMVEDNESKFPATGKDFWEKRYSINNAKVPVFLEKVAGLVLRTGKYLNVIQQCRVAVKSPLAENIVYSVSERPYFEAIEKAYTFASQTLLEMIMKDYDLIGRLRSMKHYFLLDQGDFLVQFMGSCERELEQDMEDSVLQRVDRLLEMALRTSLANGDPYKDSVRGDLMTNTIFQQLFNILNVEPQSVPADWEATENLNGYWALVFDYQVEWPVSLVLNRQAIEHYQMLFRMLFSCKHVEKKLCAAWTSDKAFKTLCRATASSYAPAFTLRQRMLNCIYNIQYYMTAEVIEPNWQLFYNKLSKVKYIDDVLEAHQDFLGSCMNDCMMSSMALLSSLRFLMSVCLEFCRFSQSEATENEDVGDRLSYSENVCKMDAKFTWALMSLMTRIGERGREVNNEKLYTLLHRLDINKYYSVKGMESVEVPGKTSG